jgi:hypothetical protein
MRRRQPLDRGFDYSFGSELSNPDVGDLWFPAKVFGYLDD